MFQQWNGTLFDGVDSYIEYSSARLDLKPLTRSRPIIHSGYGPIINDVASFKYPINIPACSSALQVFVAVISAPGYFDKRRMIRKTWLRHLNPQQVRVAFFVGRTSDPVVQAEIQKESDKYGDVIQIEMVDNYNNLALKTVAYLNWIHCHCARVPFVMKCDDDVYVNVHNLARILHSLPPDEPAVYGAYNPIETVKRNKSKLDCPVFLLCAFIFLIILKRISGSLVRRCGPGLTSRRTSSEGVTSSAEPRSVRSFPLLRSRRILSLRTFI